MGLHQAIMTVRSIPHYSLTVIVAKSRSTTFLVERISLFARDSQDLREKWDWPEVSS